MKRVWREGVIGGKRHRLTKLYQRTRKADGVSRARGDGAGVDAGAEARRGDDNDAGTDAAATGDMNGDDDALQAVEGGERAGRGQEDASQRGS